MSSSVIHFFSCLQCFPASGSFPLSQFFTSGAKVLELQLQHQPFQWIFRTDSFRIDWFDLLAVPDKPEKDGHPIKHPRIIRTGIRESLISARYPKSVSTTWRTMPVGHFVVQQPTWGWSHHLKETYCGPYSQSLDCVCDLYSSPVGRLWDSGWWVNGWQPESHLQWSWLTLRPNQS